MDNYLILKRSKAKLEVVALRLAAGRAGMKLPNETQVLRNIMYSIRYGLKLTRTGWIGLFMVCTSLLKGSITSIAYIWDSPLHTCI